MNLSRKVLIANIEKKFNARVIKYYLENSSKSGGGKLDNDNPIELNEATRSAIVTFVDPEGNCLF